MYDTHKVKCYHLALAVFYIDYIDWTCLQGTSLSRSAETDPANGWSV